MVLFPDLLPAENVLLARRSGAGAGGGIDSVAGQPTAVWGAEDVVRAVVIPRDASSRLRTYATLDLAVAAAAVAAVAAERAAEMGDVDRWVRRPSPKRSSAANGGGGGSGFGLGDRAADKGDEEDGDGGGAGAGVDRASLVIEAVSALLGCERESVTAAGMLSHGMDLFFNKNQDLNQEGGPAAPSLAGGLGQGGSRHLQQGGDGGGGGGGGGATNERASGFAGRRIAGDAVVVLVGGGAAHGAAGSGDVDGDGERAESKGVLNEVPRVLAGVAVLRYDHFACLLSCPCVDTTV